jgi:hypothetical protein
MKNNGGCFAALGNLLVMFYFFYLLHAMATSKNPFVRLLFWIIMGYSVYVFYSEWTTHPEIYFERGGFMYNLFS